MDAILREAALSGASLIGALLLLLLLNRIKPKWLQIPVVIVSAILVFGSVLMAKGYWPPTWQVLQILASEFIVAVVAALGLIFWILFGSAILKLVKSFMPQQDIP